MKNPVWRTLRLARSPLERWRQRSRFFYYYVDRPFDRVNRNIDHARRIAYIHIPKTAGTSLKRALGLGDFPAEHYTATQIHPEIWNSYFCFCVVRNPWDRLVSSYLYHTSESYDGYLTRRYPDLGSWSFEDYFERLADTLFLVPQVEFVRHRFSRKPVDLVCRFERLAEDFEILRSRLGVSAELPHLNRTTRGRHYTEFYTSALQHRVGRYYRGDIAAFGFEFGSSE